MKIPIMPKIGLFASVIVISVACSVGWLVFARAKTLLVEHEETDLRDEAKLQVEVIRNYISTMREDVLKIAGTPPVRGILRAREADDKVDPVTGVSEFEWRERLQSIFQATCLNEGLAQNSGFAQGRLADLGLAARASGVITMTEQTDPVEVTSKSHGLDSGDQIRIGGVLGMSEINDSVFQVEKLDDDTFTLIGDDGTRYTKYESGGAWVRHDRVPKPYYQVRFIGRDGREIVRIEREKTDGERLSFRKIKLATLDTDDRFVRTDRPYLKATEALGPQEVLLTDVELNREEDGLIEEPLTPVIRAAVPVFDDAQKFQGIIIINLDFNKLEIAVARSPRHRFYLTNEDGYYLMHPDRGREFAWELESEPELRKKLGFDGVGCKIQQSASFKEISDFYSDAYHDHRRVLAQRGHLFSEHLALPEPFTLLRMKILNTKKWEESRWQSLEMALQQLPTNFPDVVFPMLVIRGSTNSLVFSAPLDAKGRRQLITLEKGLVARLGKDQIKREYLQDCTLFAAQFLRLYFDPRQPDRYLGLVMAFSIDELDADLKTTKKTIQWSILWLTAIGVALAFLFSHTLTRPLAQTTRAAEKIAQGQFDVSLPVDKGDEIGDLARGFQRMLVELDSREAEIRVREARLRMIVDSAAEGIATLDEQGNFRTLNSASERMLGCSKEQFVGQHSTQLVTPKYKSLLEGCLDSLTSDLVDSPAVSLEAVAIRKDGSEFPLEISMSSVQVDDQRIFTLIMRDITERREHERKQRQWNSELEKKVLDRTAELQQTNADLELERNKAQQLSTAKDAFLASVSHELRNPLNQVTGFCQLLEFTDLDDSQREDLKKIRLAAGQLLDLINDILDYQKIIMGGMNLEAEEFEAANMLAEIRDGMKVQANHNNNAIVFEWPDDLGPLYAEPRRFRQVMVNLIGNASKFTSDGTVTVSATRHEDNGNRWLEFAVRDTGRGMTAAELEKLFTPFTKLSSKEGNRTGTGLGLVICKGLCVLMRGDIDVQSEYGDGSTFTVKLPSGPSDVAPTATKSSPESAVKQIAVDHSGSLSSDQHASDHRDPRSTSDGSRLDGSRLDGSSSDGSTSETPAEVDLADSGLQLTALANSDPSRSVLVVDDDPAVREMMQRHLSSRGFQVIAASDGLQALEMAKKMQPAVITLDAVMPGLDGWSVLAALKADKKTANIPVVMVTITDSEERAQAYGATEYFSKPTGWEELSKSLGKYTGNKCDRSILVVDDDVEARNVLRRCLQRDGWSVLEAGNGAEAFEMLAEQRPAAILLDLMMPVMDGFEFVSEFSQLGEWLSIPVVVLTAKDPTTDERQRLDRSVVRVLRKGDYTHDELLEEIHRRVDQHIRVDPTSK